MVGLSTRMRRLGIITVTNSAVVTPTLISSTAAFSRNLTLRSPLGNHHLTNSIRLLKSRSLLSSFSCFSSSSSSSAAYLPALDEFPSTKGDFFDSWVCSNPDFGLISLRNVVTFDD